jgi:hypothetical protein
MVHCNYGHNSGPNLPSAEESYVMLWDRSSKKR